MSKARKWGIAGLTAAALAITGVLPGSPVDPWDRPTTPTHQTTRDAHGTTAKQGASYVIVVADRGHHR